jgi:hypothetical protein
MHGFLLETERRCNAVNESLVGRMGLCEQWAELVGMPRRRYLSLCARIVPATRPPMAPTTVPTQAQVPVQDGSAGAVLVAMRRRRDLPLRGPARADVEADDGADANADAGAEGRPEVHRLQLV